MKQWQILQKRLKATIFETFEECISAKTLLLPAMNLEKEGKGQGGGTPIKQTQNILSCGYNNMPHKDNVWLANLLFAIIFGAVLCCCQMSEIRL